MPRFPYMNEQASGGYIALCVIVLWASRRHLMRVFTKAFGGEPELDDRHEPISYRTAVFGLVGVMVFRALLRHIHCDHPDACRIGDPRPRFTLLRSRRNPYSDAWHSSAKKRQLGHVFDVLVHQPGISQPSDAASIGRFQDGRADEYELEADGLCVDVRCAVGVVVWILGVN